MPMAAAKVLSKELIEEFMSWLPVKSLMRFRCVSKAYNSLIFNPTFIKLHLQRSSKNTHILITFQEYIKNCNGYESHVRTSTASCSIPRLLHNPSSTSYDICLQINDKYHVLGVCNGLVCLQYGCSRDSFGKYRVRFWNPATRVMSQDSPPLVGYPMKCGFGYDDCSDTYKVVTISFHPTSCKWVVKVHCLGDTCWKIILKFSVFRILEQVYGQFVSGTLNWLALTHCSKQLVIFSYDLKNEACRYLAMPDDVHQMSGDDEPYLGVLKGCLCLIQHQRRTNLVVWLMREFGIERSWTQLLNIRYWDQVLDYSPYPMIPLCMSENDDVVLLADFKEFMLVDKKAKRIHRSSRTQDYNGGLPFFSNDYVQSLIMPYRN